MGQGVIINQIKNKEFLAKSLSELPNLGTPIFDKSSKIGYIIDIIGNVKDPYLVIKSDQVLKSKQKFFWGANV